MRTRLPALALSLAVTVPVLAACGGGGSFDSGQDLADAIGCTGWENTSEEMFVLEGGSCDLGGSSITLYTFSSNDNRDKWADFAVEFYGGLAVKGEQYILTSDDEDAIRKAADTLGAEAKPL